MITFSIFSVLCLVDGLSFLANGQGLMIMVALLAQTSKTAANGILGHSSVTQA